MRSPTIKIWQPSNVYASAKLGDFVSVGAFTEIGHNVIVGERTRIGAHCFLCEGVIIGKNVFVGPKVCFTNDRQPPRPKEKWEKTVIEDGASIGAGVVILCGVTIGRNAQIGCGAVVTKSVPSGECWAGVPAKKIGLRKP